ncbi:hypothetical protein DPEC_G00149190 [Dallia pectoralis]|uniref:Uncharacterized protein n=1 Tax=Dallia pectoralis TaxID=75939 RepID=A0ACC2GIQ0_DALPE|nr:hypothetical protein DPEC_G00149190 [Dallia pectoralis]
MASVTAFHPLPGARREGAGGKREVEAGGKEGAQERPIAAVANRNVLHDLGPAWNARMFAVTLYADDLNSWLRGSSRAPRTADRHGASPVHVGLHR